MKYWKLQVGLPTSEFDSIKAIFNAGLKLETAIGSSASDSGMGFGFRDLGFTFATRDEAETAKTKAVSFLTQLGLITDVNPKKGNPDVPDHAYAQVQEYEIETV